MSEPGEHLVKLYLESKNYLVLVGRRYKIKKAPANEIDIIAINPIERDKIIGEVKVWESGITGYHFREVCGRIDEDYQRPLKLINNKTYQKTIIREVEKTYGSGFRIALYVHHIVKKWENRIRKFAKKEEFEIVTFSEIVKGLLIQKDKLGYFKDPVLQFLRIWEKTKPY